MKYVLMLLLLLAGYTHGASTSTPTFTITPTFTPIPSGFKNGQNYRDYVSFAALKASDCISSLATTPVAGGSEAWTAKLQQKGVAVMGTNTAAVRFNYQVPYNYTAKAPSGLQLWLDCNLASETNTTQVCVNVYRQKFNALTSTAQEMLGVTTNVSTLGLSGNYALINSRFSRVRLVMPAAITQTTAGDMLGIEIKRVAGTGNTGNLSIFGIEAEYGPTYFNQH